jgi:DNA-binding MarR family transcriptional regulator
MAFGLYSSSSFLGEQLRRPHECSSRALVRYYVMRSTRNVVGEQDSDPGHSDPGHYSDPPMLVLASLASGPKHGHAMIEDIVRLCGTRLGPGTLYGAIARLEQQGWIAPLRPEERRQPYRITAEGARVLRARLTTLQQFSKAGLRRLETL